MPIVTELASGRFRVQWRDRSGKKVGPAPARSFPTKSAARRFGLDREAEVRRGDDFDPTAGRALLRDWIGEWFEHRVAEPRTLSKIKGHLDVHVLRAGPDGRALGDMRLEQVDEMALQAWVKGMQRDGLAPGTIHNVFTSLKSVLKAAVRARKIPVDPTGEVTLPTIPPAGDFYWERDEVDAIRAQLTEPLDRAVLELLVGTGMRWGEATGLHLPRWTPLRRRVAVVEVLTEDAGLTLKAYPKGKKRREIPARAPSLVEAVAEHLAANGTLRCGLHVDGRGVARPCPGMVLHRDGRPLSRHAWPRQVFTPAVAAAGVRPGRVHDLRHTYASWLAVDGVAMRVIQELLGHASIRTTERYAHLAPDSLDDPRLTDSLLGRTAAERESRRESGS